MHGTASEEAMSDPSSPDFKVVDRRRSMSGEADTEDDATPDAPTESAPTEAPATDAERELDTLPDPAFLVTFGAMQMPPRTLAKALLAVFDQHAWVALGLVASPQTGEPQPDLPAAQLAIDCVHFLLGKAEPELTEEERRDAHRRLNDLRMNYLLKKQASNEV
jgi:hypothetical protein